MAFNITYFDAGGYVVHGVEYGVGKISAWFGAEGECIDVEKFDKNGRRTGQGIAKAIIFANMRYGGLKQNG